MERLSLKMANRNWQDWLQGLRKFEGEIRYAQVKSLCNAKAVTQMRSVIRNLLGYIDGEGEKVNTNPATGWSEKERKFMLNMCLAALDGDLILTLPLVEDRTELLDFPTGRFDRDADEIVMIQRLGKRIVEANESG